LLIIFVMAVSGIDTAHAQENPPPPQNSPDTAVTQIEKDLLNEFFNVLNNAQQSEGDDASSVTIEDIVSDVVKTVKGTASNTESDVSSEEVDDSDEDDDGKGKGKKKNKGKKKKDKKKKSADKNKGKKKDGLPPGLQKQLAKNGKLPPGLQKKLEASGALPPGLQAIALPQELEEQLPALPEGQKRIIVDNDVLIIDEAVGIVLDSIPDIIPPELVQILSGLPDLISP